MSHPSTATKRPLRAAAASAAASLLLGAAAASAAPVVWNSGTGANGNTYDLVFDADASWDAARAGAQARGGDLATIESQAEQDFIESVLTSNSALTGAYWFGLQETTEGVFQHVDGNPLGFANWAPNEPDNAAGIETVGQILWSDPNLPLPDPNALARQGRWNDAPAAGFTGGVDQVPSDAFRAGYLIEIAATNGGDGDGDGDSDGPTVIPLPAAAYAFPAGAAMTGFFYRRMRRRV